MYILTQISITTKFSSYQKNPTLFHGKFIHKAEVKFSSQLDQNDWSHFSRQFEKSAFEKNAFEVWRTACHTKIFCDIKRFVSYFKNPKTSFKRKSKILDPLKILDKTFKNFFKLHTVMCCNYIMILILFKMFLLPKIIKASAEVRSLTTLLWDSIRQINSHNVM